MIETLILLILGAIIAIPLIIDNAMYRHSMWVEEIVSTYEIER